MGLSFEQWDALSRLAQLELTQAYQRRKKWEMKQQAVCTIDLLGHLLSGTAPDEQTTENSDEAWEAFGV
jgi:hypothetical protein